MSDHIVKSFDDELAHLKTRLVQMGGMTENALDQATLALSTCDTELADKIIAEDDKIDAMHMELENRCTRLLALQQPMARDLRLITMAMKISNDLERVGDHAVNIAEAVSHLAEAPVYLEALLLAPRMEPLNRGVLDLWHELLERLRDLPVSRYEGVDAVREANLESPQRKIYNGGPAVVRAGS